MIVSSWGTTITLVPRRVASLVLSCHSALLWILRSQQSQPTARFWGDRCRQHSTSALRTKRGFRLLLKSTSPSLIRSVVRSPITGSSSRALVREQRRGLGRA
ncbi:hypothetical protein [Vulcanococcus limneticus]|uniref:hypothetical protein n=1 Tax=Vulcanococcus limneticus TaxID=2170428 RepID=UPI00398BDBAE